MSIKGRARYIAEAAGWPYQKARQLIIDLEQKPAEYVERHGWSLKRADAYLIDPNLDPEYRSAAARSRYIDERECENCGGLFFYGQDKKGYSDDPDSFCGDCIKEYGLGECGRCSRELLGDSCGPCGDCRREIMCQD